MSAENKFSATLLDSTTGCDAVATPLWSQPAKKLATKRSPTNADAAVGRRIRHYRLALRMSLSELSRRIGVSNPQMHRYECGLTRVAASRLIAIASALAVSIDALTTMEGLKAEVKSSEPGDVDLLLQAFRSINRQEQRNALIALAWSMASVEAHRSS